MLNGNKPNKIVKVVIRICLFLKQYLLLFVVCGLWLPEDQKSEICYKRFFKYLPILNQADDDDDLSGVHKKRYASTNPLTLGAVKSGFWPQMLLAAGVAGWLKVLIVLLVYNNITVL